MSIVSIRAALEVALNAMTPALATAWENAAFVPVVGVPYQEVNLLLAPPDNLTFGDTHMELGFMQVKLMYPLQTGAAAATARAELIRSVFRRGTSFVSGGRTVVIQKTPSISVGGVEGDRWSLVVKIRFYCNVT